MSFRRPAIPSANSGSLVIAAMVLITAALAGMVTAVAGNVAGDRVIYYGAVLSLLILGGIVVVTRMEPQRFAFLALIVCFPIAGATIPPGRFGLTVFNVTMLALAIGLIGKTLSGSNTAVDSLFPARSLLLTCLFLIPCIVFAQYPLWSLREFTLTQFAGYVFFLFVLDELKREGGFERLVLLLSITLLTLSLGLYVDHFLHMNLSLQGSNPNQLSYSASGLLIYRAGGFFQDPQKAGAFLGCMITFLLLLSVRGRFRGLRMRYVVAAAIAISIGALFVTVARTALLASLSVSAISLLAFNSWNAAVKLLILVSLMAIAMLIAQTSMETWHYILPAAIYERFRDVDQDLLGRTKIWFDYWDMFADHPLTGIGFGGFKPYLDATRPTISNFYYTAGVESGYFTILYETGILGSLAFLIMVGDAFRRAITRIVDNKTNPDTRTELFASLAALVTLGGTFITLNTLADQRIAALFVVFLAVILHRSLQHEHVIRKP